MLLAGGGKVAAEKIVPLIHAGAHVHLVSPEISEEMAPFLADVWRYDRRTVRPADVIGAGVVVAATGDADVNRRLSETARTEGILVNVADDPEHCDYYSPAIIRRGPVMVTISEELHGILFDSAGRPCSRANFGDSSRRRSRGAWPESRICSSGCAEEASAACRSAVTCFVRWRIPRSPASSIPGTLKRRPTGWSSFTVVVKNPSTREPWRSSVLGRVAGSC